ncbi:hypothetical protein GCM10010274_19270 [Streptomyces lavendofoliae]|uniref:Uncharacterized protein n=1 Tax=Streptomyces lavendofoliae TaxID=67314 RepID=A0A918M3B8_9ACTN|nr:hypothetical protein GCM10010274_19270 [Streptomyces lavendofoliae]
MASSSRAAAAGRLPRNRVDSAGLSGGTGAGMGPAPGAATGGRYWVASASPPPDGTSGGSGWAAAAPYPWPCGYCC